MCGNDCILVEVIFNEMKQFKSIRTFGKLQGHESRVEHVDFNADSSRIVTVTENGVWRLYDTTGIYEIVYSLVCIIYTFL